MKKHKYNLYREIKGEQYENLKNSISKKYDDTFPVIVYENEILDGWNRYRACKELNIDPVIKEFYGDDEAALDFVLKSNERRDLTKDERAVMALAYLPLIETEAEKRKLSNLKQNNTEVPKSAPRGKSRDVVSKQFNVGHTKIQEAKTLQKDRPDLFEKVKEGDLSIEQAKKEIRRDEVKKQIDIIKSKPSTSTNGKYDVIVIDPPWQMEKIERDVAPNQVGFDYPTMTYDEIKALKLPAADDCHLWMWTTHKHLPYGFDILNAWGFSYVCTYVWHKAGGFQPFNLPMYNCEFALYARKGTPKFIDHKDMKVCFNADRKGHSKKPDEFYELVRRITGGARIDMFNRREITGFSTWGNECL